MTKPFVLAGNSKTARAIREAYDRLVDVQHELEKAIETPSQPEAIIQHIMKAHSYASKSMRNLMAAEVIQSYQLPIDN